MRFTAIKGTSRLTDETLLYICAGFEHSEYGYSKVTNSSKHIQAMTAVDRLNAEGTVEMAAEVAGGRESLRRRPIISSFQCSVSPLSYDEKSLEAAFVFGEAGVPTGFLNMTIGCGTAPATIAGSAAQANAESVRIIHGHGTGTVRQIVRDFLATHPLVKSFRSGQRDEGGDGVTVARL